MMLSRSGNAMALMCLLEASGNVRHIAFGHVELSGSIDGASYSPNHGACHKIVDGSSYDRALHGGAPPAFDVLLTDKDGVRMANVEPPEPDDIIARAQSTPDGRGHIEYLSTPLMRNSA